MSVHWKTLLRGSLKPCLDFFFITSHSISVTYHLSLKTPHPIWHHYSLVITQYFSTVCELTWCSFYSFFFFNPQYPNSPNPVKKKTPRNLSLNLVKEEEKKNPETARSERRRRSHLVWKGKKKKWRNRMHRTQWRKKEERVKSCSWVWQWDHVCDVIYENAIKNRVMET